MAPYHAKGPFKIAHRIRTLGVLAYRNEVLEGCSGLLPEARFVCGKEVQGSPFFII
jgi:hypothetical protein